MKRSTVPFAILIPLLFLAFLESVVAQEILLANKYAVGHVFRYRVTSQSSQEGRIYPGGRLEELTHRYYTLTVTAVNKEGTATVTFKQDSVNLWVDKKPESRPYVDELNGVPVTMWITNRGILLDVQSPSDMSKEAKSYLDLLLKDLGTEPPIPGEMTEVGVSWQNELPAYFVYTTGTLKGSNLVKSKFVRKQSYRGVDCAQIEYNGILMANGQKFGSVTGTTYHALQAGKTLRTTSETEKLLYLMVKGERSQIQAHETRIREALN
jgi:hypothetical protein